MKIQSTKCPFQQSVFIGQFPSPSKEEREREKEKMSPWCYTSMGNLKNKKSEHHKCILHVSSDILITVHKHTLPVEQSKIRFNGTVLPRLSGIFAVRRLVTIPVDDTFVLTLMGSLNRTLEQGLSLKEVAETPN